MSITINKIETASEMTSLRQSLSSFFVNGQSQSSFGGPIHSAIKLVEENQLLDPARWSLFVSFFRDKADSPDRAWRGEFWGKMMRGAAFTYSYTKNDELYDMLTETVIDMLSTEDENGRISTYEIDSKDGFSEFDGWDLWSRKYVLLGMQYYLEICKDKDLKDKIIASMCRQMDYIISKIGRAEDGKKRIVFATRNWRGLNSSSILEPVVRLYEITGKKDYLDFADYIISEGGTSIFNLFETAYEDVTDPYQYPITKAYEMISCFEGLLEYYYVTGIEKHKETVIRFANRVLNTDVTIIGCCGSYSETFDHSSARQTDSTFDIHSQETCVTVTWMKFCLRLLELTGDVRFADCFEQSLYNAYLGAINTENAINNTIFDKHPDAKHRDVMPFDSYSPMLGGVRGGEIGGFRAFTDGHFYGCCTCIGSAGTGMISKVSTMLSDTGIVLNLFIPGTTKTMTPSGEDISIVTKTEYPVQGKVQFALELQKSEAFEIKIRVPNWSKKTTLNCCGKSIDATPGYVSIEKTWCNGDTIEIELDMRAQLLRPVSNPRDLIITKVVWGYDYLVPRLVLASADAENRLAIKRGPLVLARDARLGEDVLKKIDVTPDEDDFVALDESDKADFSRIVEFKTRTDDGEEITLIDYASAGKTWNEKSKFACWLPTNRKYTK